jgi:hypothetical protein
MEKRQERRFNMYLTTVDFCEQSSPLLGPLPNFSNNLIKLKGINEQIFIFGGEQSRNITGTTVAKKDLRINLENLSADAARKAMAFATVSKNPVLFGEVNYALTDLRRMPDTLLAETSDIIHSRIDANLTDMVEYQVTAATQQSYRQAINDYKASLATPRITEVTKKVATAKLAELFKNGDAVLEEMDAVVEIIRITQPDIYLGYKSARKVIETGTGKLAVKGLVTDSQNGEPVKGVTVSFWPDGDPNKLIAVNEAPLVVKKTAEKGGFNIASLPGGTYRATLHKVGYTEQSLTVYVNDGEMTTMEVALAKNEG